MLATNYTSLRDNMKEYFDKVTNDYETLIVTRKKDTENMVIMSQSTYDSLMETIYLMSNKTNYNHLMESIEQHKKGKTTIHKLIEVKDE